MDEEAPTDSCPVLFDGNNNAIRLKWIIGPHPNSRDQSFHRFCQQRFSKYGANLHTTERRFYKAIKVWSFVGRILDIPPQDNLS